MTAAPTKPKRKYTRRKAASSANTTRQQPTEEPTGPYSQYVTELGNQLASRSSEITTRLEQIERESDALEVEESALKQEQERIQAGIKALEEK